MDSSAHRHERTGAEVSAAIGCTAIVGVAMGSTWPLFSLKMHLIGLSGIQIGISASTQALSVLLIFPFAPKIIHALGVRRTMAASIVVAASTMMMFSLVEDTNAWAFIRIILGISVATIFIAAETWFMATVPPARIGVLGGVFGLVWSAAFASGPLILLAVGTSGSLPFLVVGAIILAGLGPLGFARQTTPSIGPMDKVRATTLILVAPIAILSALVQGLLDSINDTFIPLYGLANGLTIDGSMTLLAVILLGLSGVQIPMGMLADRFSSRILIAVIGAVIALAAISLPLTITRSWLLWPNAFILGAGVGALWVTGLVMVATLFPTAQLAQANAARSMLYSLGSAAGPVMAGAATEGFGRLYLPCLIAILGASLGLGVLAGRLKNSHWRETKKRSGG